MGTLLHLGSAGAAPHAKLPTPPLAFEPNQGQTSDQVSYLARGKGYTLFLKPTEAVVTLKPSPAGSVTPEVLRMRLVGTSPRPRLQGADALPGRHNYYIGSDPKHWHTNIPTYARVISTGLYPGIDMVYRGVEGQLEYDFMVAPGADPRAIRMSFTGNKAIKVNPQGDLVLTVGGERIVHRAPYAYQTLNGAVTPVKARYAVSGRTVAFELGAYDRSRPLVIDPALVYSSYLGGNGPDEARAVAVDDAGNIYITGRTASSDLPAKTNITAGGYSSDAFVTKLNSSGAVVFTTYLGSGGSNEPVGPPKPEGLGTGTETGDETGEKGNAIAIGPQGRIYVTGGTAGSVGFNGFPTVNKPYHSCPAGNGDVFVSIFNKDNGSLYYSTCVGGGFYEEGLGIAVDSGGNAYVVGYTTSDSNLTAGVQDLPFPTTNGALQAGKISVSGARDSFFFKLDPTIGTAGLIYSTYFGSGSSNTVLSSTYATTVAVDDSGNAYVAGWTEATAAELATTGFPTTGAYQATTTNNGNPGKSDAFVYKINPTPNASGQLLYGSFLGGGAIDKATGIAMDGAGDIYVAGQTTSSDFFPSASGLYKTLNGNSDGFVAKIHPAAQGLSDLLYATYLGGSADDGIQGIAVDGSGNAYVTGWTEGGLPSTDGSVHIMGTSTLQLDAFVAGLNASGSSLTFASYLGGTSDDLGRGIALSRDTSGKIYVAGGTLSSDFPTLNAAQASKQAGEDAFVAVIGTVVDMAVTLSATDPFPNPFDPLTYTVTVTNNGPEVATGVVLSLVVEAVGASAPPLDSTLLTYDTSLCTVAVGSDRETFTCNLGTMAATDSRQLSFSGPLTTLAAVKSTATVSADQTDTDPTNNALSGAAAAGQTLVPTPVNTGGGGGGGGSSSGGGGGGGTASPLSLLLILSLILIGPTRRRTKG